MEKTIIHKSSEQHFWERRNWKPAEMAVQQYFQWRYCSGNGMRLLDENLQDIEKKP